MAIQNPHYDNTHRFSKEGACDHCEREAKIFVELRCINNKLEELKRLCVHHWVLYYDPGQTNLDALIHLIDWNRVFSENARLNQKYNPDPFHKDEDQQQLFQIDSKRVNTGRPES